ncbi:DEAD/DEAH box helicase [bacterium]|nr:DEAD/DEAH box helicase [bacterium]
MPSFQELSLSTELQKAISETGYTTPTPIQEKAIPYLLDKKDLLGCAQTGTGKTAAFALPLLQNLIQNPRRANPKQARVLILTPTRELAIQIHDSFKTYGKYLRLKYAVVFGGVGQTPQVQAVAQGVDVLIATPGRLMDLINQRYIRLNELEVFVLDEADRMLDMGFIHAIRKIIALLPKQRHNLFFSATMPKDILQLSETLLTNPVKVEVAPVSSTADKISQSVLYVDKARKRDLLRHVLQDKKLSKVIVFTRTKHGANRVVETLVKNNIRSAAIHGNKSQSARQKALEDFKRGNVRVLVATDIAARGIDIDDVSHVINFELPNISESYVHRIGRTARAGADGEAISFCDQEEKAYVKDIEKLIGKSIPVNPDHPYHSREVESARTMSKGKAKAQIEAKENHQRGPRRPQQGGGRPQGGGPGGPKKSGGKPFWKRRG